MNELFWMFIGVGLAFGLVALGTVMCVLLYLMLDKVAGWMDR
jgi:hypothetical protein